MDLTGSCFKGKYDVLKRVTEDENTESYIAKHVLLDTEFMIEIMKMEAIASIAEVKKFQFEMRGLAQNPSDKKGLVVDFSILEDGRPYAVLVPPTKMAFS
jgi:hypothetical protein